MKFAHSVLVMTGCGRIKNQTATQKTSETTKCQKTQFNIKPYNQTSIYYFINSKYIFKNYIAVLVMAVPKVITSLAKVIKTVFSHQPANSFS